MVKVVDTDQRGPGIESRTRRKLEVGIWRLEGGERSERERERERRGARERGEKEREREEREG